MMGSKRYTVAVGLLLCAANVLCSDGVENPKCSWKEECFFPDFHLNNSDPFHLSSVAGKKLIVFLSATADYTDCKWGRKNGTLKDIKETVSIVIPRLSRNDFGLYTLSCKGLEGTSFSKTVDLYVTECPSKPQLLLDGMDVDRTSPLFKCLSEGSSRPEIEWVGPSSDVTKSYPSDWGAESTDTSSHYFDREVTCCATNEEGKECTQLYDLDLSTDSSKPDNVTISPGEPLLLRCRKYQSSATWEHNGKLLEDSCSKNEICIKRDRHRGNRMLYAFIRPAALKHSGRYTCKDSKNKTKTIFVDVTDQSFLSSQLPDQFVINDTSSCLTAVVSYHPALQLCYWEAPDGSFTKCIRDQGVTQTRTVKYCGPFQSGAYKLHLEAGEKIETKSTSVCVVERPSPIFTRNETGINIETVSILPANSAWNLLVSSNISSEITSFWEVIQTTYHRASNDFCNQKISSYLSTDPEVELKFCLTDQAGSWCKEYHIVQIGMAQMYKGAAPSDSNLKLLQVGIVALLVALIVVTVFLMYYVKKKRKPQYQPELQMIQMVGPNDNDYIYINFKDFDYDKKWEFPRENLELGKELGSGAFGMVVQATAYGISESGVSQQVAVKMLKEKHQSVEKEALMSELKMLTHIGQHDNIVNLLGACTETGPIYLIFQYCCYGDLLNYLKKSGDRYHKSVTDAFSNDRFSSLYCNLQPKKNSNDRITAMDHYLPMHDSTTRGQEDIALIPFTSFDVEEMYESEDDPLEQQALTFNDLLNFAYQVAKGMEFLSAKNCIHRDLAARNVLVTKGRLVKIGDFGLARDIDNDSNYVVRGNVRLPVKWMAPESIFQGMYTMKSDVWAYGILLWEIFSLGVTPYPGIKVDSTFYSMIERGFKMECPYYASDSVYRIMCNCWALDPNNRPSFSKLVDFMSDQLMDMEEMLYQKMHDQDVSVYQNASTIGDISALVKETGSKTAEANNYSKANLREETKAEALKSEASEKEEEEPLKPSDGE